jgi:hypothetical protein
MNSSDQPAGDAAGARGGDRRQGDRRRDDRRAPLPPWRRPWAYVAYGVVGVLAILLLFSLGDDAEEAPAAAAVGTTSAGPEVDTAQAMGAGAAVRDAHGAAGFEALLAEGEAAVGRQVRTTLYCEPIQSIGLRRDADVAVNASVAQSADAAGRVPAAECRWGRDSTAPELLLIVPPSSAGRFASMPEVEQSFVLRREVPAEVEWIGRSEALALRNVAVLRSIGTAAR